MGEGELESYSIHYDQFGRSTGTAEVVFTKQSDALAALKKYNNMRLDGKPLQIELVGTSLATLAPTPLDVSSLLGRPNAASVRDKTKIGGSRYHNSLTHGRLPRVKKDSMKKVSFRDIDHDHNRLVKAKHRFEKLSVKDLDDDLEKYRLEAMQTNKANGKGKVKP